MSLRTSVLGIATGAVMMLVAPTSALAVTGTINAACVSHLPGQGSQPIVVALTGGTPGAGYVMAATGAGKALGSQGSASGNFDAAGNAVATIRNISPPSGTSGPTKGQAVAITVKDFGTPNPPDQLIGTTLVTNIALSVSSSPRNPRLKRTVSVSGTPFAGKTMYGFVVKGTNRTILRRFSLGRANGCGFATRKAIVAPTRFRSGSYRLYVNAGSKLDKPNSIFSSFRITIF